MKKVLLKNTIGFAVAVASTQLFAAGFALNEQSISGMGTGFAGRSSSADDASTVFGNPAGMARLKREQVTVGAAAILAKSDTQQRRQQFPRRQLRWRHGSHRWRTDGLLRQAN